MSPFAVDSAIEASNGGLFPLAALDMLARARKGLSQTKTWEFSTIFGAAAVATGGFHLAMRESAAVQDPLAAEPGRLEPGDGPLARVPRAVERLPNRNFARRDKETGFGPREQRGLETRSR